MARDFDGFPAPAARSPEQPEQQADGGLKIVVVYTSAKSTFAALQKAGILANHLDASITLLVPQVVPYPLPLEDSPVLVHFSECRLRAIAGESPVETTVHLYLCRDRMELLKSVLNPRSLVIVGCRKGWWPSDEKRLASQLICAGHEVVFAEAE